MNIPLTQVTLFGLVGLANTLVDFAIYNLLTRPPFRFTRIQANLCSTTAAMAFSFVINFFLVFHPEASLVTRRVVRFLAVTAFSLYVVQTLVIYVTSQRWTAPVRLACATARCLPWLRTRSEEFIAKNTVKLLATLCSMIWNFFWYKFYVYAG